MVLPADHTAPRVRAAIAYAGMTREQFAQAIGTSPPTLDRMTSKTAPRQLSVEDMQRIARAAGVPPHWFTADFSLLDQIAAFPPPLNGERQDPPGDLGQSAEGSPPTGERPRRKSTEEEGDEDAAAE